MEQLDLALQRIAANPQQFPITLRDVRRALMHRFPYSLLFRVEEDTLTIVACFHANRDPQSWQRRGGG